MLTVTEAAVQLGVSTRWVRQVIVNGDLKATKKGKTWIISENALKAFAAKERRPGNPHNKRR